MSSFELQGSRDKICRQTLTAFMNDAYKNVSEKSETFAISVQTGICPKHLKPVKLKRSVVTAYLFSVVINFNCAF